MDENPQLAPQLGEFMGEQLSIMHRVHAQEGKSFGKARDTGYVVPYASRWNDCLIGIIANSSHFLREMGMRSQEIQGLTEEISAIQFSNRGVYVHGDFHPGSVLIRSLDPLDAAVIDPNSFNGHPDWDYAKAVDKVERNALMTQMDINISDIKP